MGFVILGQNGTEGRKKEYGLLAEIGMPFLPEKVCCCVLLYVAPLHRHNKPSCMLKKCIKALCLVCLGISSNLFSHHKFWTSYIFSNPFLKYCFGNLLFVLSCTHTMQIWGTLPWKSWGLYYYADFHFSTLCYYLPFISIYEQTK